MKDFQRCLVLSPHTDDGEFGCGGTIARFVREGKVVYYAAFSVCEDSVPVGLPRNILEVEVKSATQVLGIPPENLHIYRYPVRHHPQNRQKILDNLVQLKAELDPDLVLMPCAHDIHQDHNTVYQEGLRAFKHCSILGYELPWNNLVFQALSFVYLNEEHIEKKIEALKVYQSQRHRPYANEEFIRSLARTRGVQSGTQYAEAFEVIRWIIR